MSCTAMRKKIKAYLDGELPAGVAEVIKSHLAKCPACSQEAAALSKTWELLLEMPDVQEVPDLIPATLARILAEGKTPGHGNSCAGSSRFRFLLPQRLW